MKKLLLASLVAISLIACRAPEGEERWPGSLRVNDEHSGQLQRDEMRLSAPAEDIAGEEEYNIVREISARREQMFAADPPQQVLDEAEMIFLRTGQLPELLGYYEEALEAREEPTPLLARSAWLYQRLGLEALALERARTAAEQLPDDPFAHFALAYVLGQQADRLGDPYPEIIDALALVLQISPDFQVTGVVERDQLESEYRRLVEEHGTQQSDEAAP